MERQGNGDLDGTRRKTAMKSPASVVCEVCDKYLYFFIVHLFQLPKRPEVNSLVQTRQTKRPQGWPNCSSHANINSVCLSKLKTDSIEFT